MAPRKGEKTIIVTDDEPLALRGTMETAGEVFPGFRIEGFARVTDALEFAGTKRIDAAFLDIEMPMGGVFLAKELQKLNPRVNIIFTTGYRDYYEEAMKLYASGYIIKPVTVSAMRDAAAHLRYPLEVNDDRRPVIHTLGEFQVFIDNEPVRFKYRKTSELIAFLVDRRGTMCSNERIIAFLWEDEYDAARKKSYLRNLRKDIRDTFISLGSDDVCIVHQSEMGLDRNKVRCDLFELLDGRIPKESFAGEYMSQFSWAEETRALLTQLYLY